jgi:hypothetical protein
MNKSSQFVLGLNYCFIYLCQVRDYKVVIQVISLAANRCLVDVGRTVFGTLPLLAAGNHLICIRTGTAPEVVRVHLHSHG